MAAAEDQYFYEDEVYRINKRGHIEFGMVLENSELVSSDENSDREDGLRKGHIRVAWHPSGVEEVIHERKVGLADRSLMPGDVVRRMIKGKDTQRGYCRDIFVTACVQVVGTKQVIIDVPSEQLVPLEEFASDIAVCLDSWVGGIKMVHTNLHLFVPDGGAGSRCIINDLEANRLEEFDEKREADSEFPHRNDFYPGQILFGPLHSLEYSNWTHCTKEMRALRNKPNKSVKVVVERIETDSVTVQWQCRAYSKDGAGLDKEQPPYVISGDAMKRLKLLNVFEPCTLQVGDRNFYTCRADDSVVTKEVWRRNQRDLFKPQPPHRRRHPHKKSHTTACPSCKDVLACKEPPTDSSPLKVPTRPPKANQSVDIMSCQDKPVDNVPPKSKETMLDQGRKKRIIAEPKTGHSRQSAASDTKLRSNSQSVSRRTVKSEAEDAPNPEEGDDSCHTLNSAEADGDFEDVDSSSDDESISSGCSSNGSHGMKKRAAALMTRVLKKKKLRRAKKRAPLVPLEPGTKVVVETLSTVSVADVIWQDGSIEKGIPSTQLYPIHHLDDQEFFPGDFVMENKDENTCMRVYGVIQSVEHAGRTARVKWFKTYTSSEQPQPSLLEENEVSVYDLKDHPDFQYRPGTVVIRVANFEGEDANCTAGQVLDNYPEGKVRVWWVDGHISMCWPQDLYKVGGYDSDEGELWDDGSSEASWETESEDTFVADEGSEENTNLYETLKPKLAANIEKARIAMSRLEEIFTQNPALQTTEVMRKLLEVYKDCRYLDKLMGTSFFHESHFQGLLERVRERGRANVAQRVADQVSRLFQPCDLAPTLDVTPLTEPELENYPEFRLAMQMAEQISELVQSQCQPATPKTPNFLEKLSESSATVKVFHSILQLFQKSLFRWSADKDVCNNEKKDSVNKIDDLRTGGRVLAEIKLNPSDIGECEPNKSYVLRLRFNQTDAEPGSPERPEGATLMSPLSMPQLDDSDVMEPDSPEPRRLDRESVADPNFASGEFLTESLAMLERRVSAAAACAMASGPTRKLAKRMASILGKFGSVTCELLSGDEVMFSMDLGTGNGPRHRQTSSSCPSPPPAQPPATPPPNVIVTSLAATSSTQTSDSSAACSNSAVCVRLCSLIKAQLVKAHSEVTRRFGGTQLNMTLSDAANSLSPNSNKEEDGEAVPKSLAAPAEPSPAVPLGSDVEMSVDPVQAPKEVAVPGAEEGPSTPLLATEGDGGFAIEDSAPNSHKFKLTIFQPTDHQNFYRTVRKEIKLLRSSLPSGIWVKGFEDRMDLYSVMIRGPERTPYEDGLFFFDFQLSSSYPSEPPLCHYISYCSDRLNPNLYEDGKVCVSLLGTWSGKGTEVWTLGSNLLQVIVSIQGLILVSEPYFNEAGYEKQKGSQQGRENSRMYNEMVVLKLVQAMSKLVQNPPPAFQDEIKQHFHKHAQRFSARLESWLEVSERYNNSHPLSPTTPTTFREMAQHDIILPEFPLIPASKGFCLTLRKSLATFRDVMQSVGIIVEPSKWCTNQAEDN